MRLPFFSRRTGKPRHGQSPRLGNDLVALGSAAVLTIYTAGYLRTRAAAERFDSAAVRRPLPAVIAETATGTPAPPALPSDSAPVPAAPAKPAAPRPPQRTTPRRTGVTRRQAAAPVGGASASSSALPVVTEAIGPPAPRSNGPAPVSTTTPVTNQTPTTTSVDVPPVTAPPAAPKYKDGTYYGWGTSRHGDIQAAVVIENGRIASATIAQCLTRYSCSVISRLPPQVAERQSPEVDYVSGATQSTNAFYYAVVEALGKAK